MTKNVVALLLLLPTPILAQNTGQLGPNLPAFTVRPGYKVTLAVDTQAEARFIEFDDTGKTLFLAQPKAGTILALTDKDGDGVFETSAKFITGKPTAHGMYFKDGWLWFTQSQAIFKARDTNADGIADETVTIAENLPGKTGHWWRSIYVTGDAIYTSVGDSGNASDELENSERQKIWKYSLDGKSKTLFSSGVRNTEKLRMRPGTNELWGVDHNSDNFGKDLGEDPKKGIQPVTDAFPPEELNHYVEGGFYGHPFLVGNRVPRLEFQKHPKILELAARTNVPALQLGAHWAGNGWTFLTKDHFSGHKGDMFVAFHGSWNSTNKVGYRIERVLFDEVTGKPYGAQMIVSTLGTDGKTVLARPVDCAEAPDGSVLFSCDHTKRVYRISKAN